MKISKSQSGRIVVDLDGYSEGYRAYVQGAVTGRVSLPAEAEGRDEQELAAIAEEVLRWGPNYCFGPGAKAKVLRAMDLIR